MNDQQINRYLYLVDRRLFIFLHSGIDWKPEYGPELEAIDKELEPLKKAVDKERERRNSRGMCKNRCHNNRHDK